MRYRVRVYFSKLPKEKQVKNLLDDEFNRDEVYIEKMDYDDRGVAYVLLNVSDSIPVSIIQSLENSELSVVSVIKENIMKNKKIIKLPEDMIIKGKIFKAGTKIEVKESHMDDIEDEFAFRLTNAFIQEGPEYAAEEIEALLQSFLDNEEHDYSILTFLNLLSQKIDRLTQQVARNI